MKTFRPRQPLRALTAVAVSLAMTLSGLAGTGESPAHALVQSNGACSATVNTTSGVSVYDDGTYCYVAFKTAGTSYQWTPPSYVTSVNLLVVAGGGGGGTRHGSGGGAGGLIQQQAVAVNGAAVSVSVGAGGAGAAASAWTGVAGGYPDPSSGQNSVVSGGGLTTQTAIGGGSGVSDAPAGNGGSGGGGSCCTGLFGSGTSGQGFNGSTGYYPGSYSYYAGGAGGGAGGTGGAVNASSQIAALGGAGANVSWISPSASNSLVVGHVSSTLVYFASGGGGGGDRGSVPAASPGGGTSGQAVNNSDVADALANTGGGGGGSGLTTSGGSPAGGDGGSGVVVVRYAQQFTVTYNYDGATGGNTTPSEAWGGTALTLPTPTKTGYYFQAWYADSAKTTLAGRAAGAYSPTSNITLYAAWTNMLVNLDMNDASSYNPSVPGTWKSSLPGSSTASGTITGPTYNSGALKSLSFSPLANSVAFDAGVGGVDGSSLTVETWINPGNLTGGSDWNIIASRWFTDTAGNGIASNDWHFAFKKDPVTSTYKLNLYTTGPAGASGVFGTTTFPAVSANKWYLIGFTISAAGQLQFYVNGVPDGAPVTVARTNRESAKLFLGDPRTGAYPLSFAGKMSTFRIYNTALSTADVQNNFAATAATFGYTPITATFNANDGSVTPATSTQSAVSTVNFSLATNTFTRTGYIFAGWTEAANGSGTLYTDGQATSFSASKTLYAQWTANTFPVSFNANNGAGSMANQTVSSGISTALTSNIFTRTGYTFAGWNTASLGGGTNYTDGQAVTLSGALTLYAKWTANSNTVTFKANDGASTADVTQSIITNQATALTSNAFTRTGYTFAGWTVNSDGTGIAYSNAQLVTLTGPLTIHAKWTANSNTVTFKANDGASTADATQSITSGQSTALRTNTFTRAGYTFAGWAANADGTGSAYSNGQSVTITGALTVFAKWTLSSVIVTYGKNGASGAPERASETFNVGSAALTLPTVGTMTKAGYTFDGWSETVNGTKISGAYTPTANITLQARWVAASFSVTYDTNGATSGAPSATVDSYTTGSTAITLATVNSMVRTGYTFAGWSTVVNDVSAKVLNSGSYTITAPVILFALWTANDYSVTYSNQGSTFGAVPSDLVSYHIGNTSSVKANSGGLVKTGYTFAGWTTTADNTGTVYQSGSSYQFGAASVTLYPKWTPKTFTVTYIANGASGAASRSSDTYTTGDAGLSLPNIGTMVKTGYDFQGWSTSPTGSAYSGAFTTTVDVNLYAIWTLKSIAYNYERGAIGGTPLTNMEVASFPTTASQSGLYGSSLTLSSTVSSTITVNSVNYKFVGWYDGNSTYAAGDPFLLGSSSSTFTAQWARLYAVRYALNGGTGIAAADSECTQADYSCSLNDPIHLSDAPTRDGYLFTGWKDQSNATHIAGASVTVTDTVYLFYAQWMAVDYTVSFDAAGGSSTTADATKHIGDTMTLPSAGTKIGYDFAGWAVGSQVLGAGATYIVGAGNAAFTAQWVAKTYAVSYNWNGGSGTPVADGAYVFGTSALSLPIGSTHSRDGYVFAGWSVTNGGAAIGSTIAPTQDTVLFARWADGAYVVTYNVHGGTGAAASASVARAASVVLPTPTRAGFTFDGWFEDSLTRVVAGNAGATYSPTASLTLHAKWVQNSLYGINPAHINTRSTTQVNGGEVVTVTHAATGTGATVTVPSGSLNNGTELKVSFIEDLTRPRTLIDNSFAYFTSVIVHWSEGVGDNAVVAPTAPNKPISLTLTNSAIKTGAKVFMILNGVATEAAEATQDGQVTILITQDPEFVLAATTPRQPASVSATTVASSVATVSWTAPTSTGGADITGYTATAMPGGATCTTTAALSCDITGLNDATTYTYSVVASNAIGGSGATAVAVTYTPPAPSSSPTSPTPSPASSPIAGDSAATTIAVSPTRSGSLTPSVAPNVTPTPTVIAPSSGAPAVDVAQGEASSQPVEFPVLLTFVMLFLLALVLAAVIFFLIRRRRS